MKWQGREESGNVEDRRGFGKGTLAIGGGVGGILMVIVALVFGVDPRRLVEFPGQDAPNGGAVERNNEQARPADPEEERMASFSKVVFHDTEVIWEELFRKMGKQYRNPVMVLYSGQVDSACGTAESAVGPFYCPGDSRVYIDLSFYRDMQRKLNAPGEFARAYVLAHEVGHHVQRQLGYSQREDQARQRPNKGESNKISVRYELQADFFAGVWAHHAQKKFGFLEKGDMESALNAAFAIGDDRLQKKAQGYVVPDSFTHGTSKQRMRWFTKGFEKGEVSDARSLFDLRDNEL